MNILKKLRNWCPQPKTPFSTRLHHNALSITLLLTITLMVTSFGVLSYSGLSSQKAPVIPVANLPATTGDNNFTVPPTLQWDANYGSGDVYYAGSVVVQTSDGGYIFAGANVQKYPTSTVLLIKTDSAGKMLWNKTFGD
jgi:hypothetical protein